MVEELKRLILEFFDYKELKKKYPIITEGDLFYLYRRLHPVISTNEDMKKVVESICGSAQLSKEMCGYGNVRLQLKIEIIQRKIKGEGKCSVCNRKRKEGENYCPACGNKFPEIERPMVIKESQYWLLDDECDELRNEMENLRHSIGNKWYANICPYCGHENENRSSVCENCGKDI